MPRRKKSVKKEGRFKSNRYALDDAEYHIPPSWWLKNKKYGSNKGIAGERANANARARRALERLEACALEQLAHRELAAEKRRDSVAGKNLEDVANWAAENRNKYGGVMAKAIKAGWALARANGYTSGSGKRVKLDKKAGVQRAATAIKKRAVKRAVGAKPRAKPKTKKIEVEVDEDGDIVIG